MCSVGECSFGECSSVECSFCHMYCAVESPLRWSFCRDLDKSILHKRTALLVPPYAL